MDAAVHTRASKRGALAALCLFAWGCSPGSPVLCEAAQSDGGCSYHVEVHCGDVAQCSSGSVQVLDAGSCVRDPSGDVIGCT